MIFTEPGEAFFLLIKMAAVAGLLISSPYVMWQVWLFIAPGLYANEKKLAVPFVFFATTLFISGAAFSHYVLFPLAWQFFASFSNEFLAFTPRVEPVWSLYVKLLLAMGLVFQLPMLMFVLARFGIVTARFLVTQLQVRGAHHLHRRRHHHARREHRPAGHHGGVDDRALRHQHRGGVAFGKKSATSLTSNAKAEICAYSHEIPRNSLRLSLTCRR